MEHRRACERLSNPPLSFFFSITPSPKTTERQCRDLSTSPAVFSHFPFVVLLAAQQQNLENMETTITTPKKASIRIRWDEETIAEHDLLRGTRQKIDEPDTPFAHHHAAEEETTEDGSGVGVPKREPERRSSFDEKVPTTGQSMSIFDNWEGVMSYHKTLSLTVNLHLS